MRKFLLSLMLLIPLTGMLAGCGAQITAPEIIQHLKDTATSTTDVHMVVDLSFNMTGTAAQSSSPDQSGSKMSPLANMPTSGKATVEMWYKQPNLVRAEVKSADQTGYAGAQFVSDGQALWAYDPSHKMGYKLDLNAVKSVAGQAGIPTDLQDLLADPNLTAILDKVLSLTDATVAGTETVAGFNTYKLTLQPKADTGLATTALGVSATMWVDQKTWMVVKLDVTSAQGDLHYSAQTIEINHNVPDSTFKFTLPAGATGVDLSMFLPRPVTLEQARSQATAQGWTLLTPSAPPAGATLTGVLAQPMMGGLLLTYSGSADVPTVVVYEMQAKGTMPGGMLPGGMTPGDKEMFGGANLDGASVQTVTVRGHEGRAFTKPAADGQRGGTFITWDKNGLRLAVGGNLSLDAALKVAESLK